ncbi:MAG: DUF1549 and DUF1553 domain-containing protein [Planctomycetota bacterium]
MRSDETIIAEMTPLLEALCEDRLAPEQAVRLEQCVLASDAARWHYISYVDLHGSLYWNAGGVGSAEALSSDDIPVWTGQSVAEPVAIAVEGPSKRVSAGGTRWNAALYSIVSVCACMAVLVGWSQFRQKPVVEVAQPDVKQLPAAQPVEPANAPVSPAHRYSPVELAANQGGAESGVNADSGPGMSAIAVGPVRPPAQSNPVVPPPPQSKHENLDSHEVVAAINADIRRGWEVASVRPSPVADDSEWLRRVSLDLIGRIPTVDEAEAFLSSKRPNKRSEAVDKLLDNTEFARNWTTVFTNVLIGRRSDQRVNRPAFQKFLRMSFAANRPWNQIVYDLIAAEGNNVEKGETNFLIAHLNNDALPATAVTARVFLGEQLQCNQCHNNPFNKSQQLSFWEMHSFFSQTACVPRQAVDPKTGKSKYSYTELVTNTADGPIFFETQNGLMKVAFPRFHGETVDASPETNRRDVLARMMTEGDQPQLATAFVNRMWEHFFGRGFTHSADDMGPHSPASHPELLNQLSRQFIRSGYDTKQLVRWICNSEPYQLTSRFGVDNRDDDPVEGALPAFSRMYVKPMTPEQVYDSFVIATKAHQSGGVDWEQAEGQRQRWLSQFVVDYGTDENDEAMELDGNLVQALTLMNGKLIEEALETNPGTYLGEVIRRRGDEKEKIRELCLAALSRPPTSTEMAAMRKLVRRDGTHVANRGSVRVNSDSEGYQDLFWALLNSNEFTVIH